MKAVALILALAVITGCNARVVRQAEATKDPWEESVDRFWKYIAKLGQNADGVVENLKTSQLSMELDTLITDTMAELETYKNSIQTKLVPYTETATAQLSQDVQLLINRLQKDMLDAKERSIEYHSELKATVDHNTGDLESRITTFTHKLQKHLKKDIEEIRSTVATWVGEIQSRASQNLDTLKEHVEPYVQQANDNTNKKLSDISAISAVLQSEAEGLGQQLQTQAEDIKTQLKATGEELRMSLQGKIEEMTELFSPYATKIREQFEEIVDKLKESTTA